MVRWSRGAWKRLADNLAELSTIPSRISKPVAQEINLRIRVQFRQGSDPYGNPWAPLSFTTVRKKKGSTLIMIATGRMSRETMAVPMPSAGVELVTVPYAAYHQVAAPSKNRPARPVLPSGKELPVTWRTAIENAYAAEFGRIMNR